MTGVSLARLDANLPPDPHQPTVVKLATGGDGGASSEVLQKIVEPCLDDVAPVGKRSDAIYRFMCRAAEAGCSDTQMADLLRRHRMATEKWGRISGATATREVNKARKKHDHAGRMCIDAGCPDVPDWQRESKAKFERAQEDAKREKREHAEFMAAQRVAERRSRSPQQAQVPHEVLEPSEEEEDERQAEDDQSSSWSPLALDAYVDGTFVPPEPAIMPRLDGPAMFYPGKLHTVIGESESMKSWLLLVACATVLMDGGVAVYIDFEDSPESVVGRLLALGVPPVLILSGFRYSRPEEPLFVTRNGGAPALHIEALTAYADACDGAALVVLDGLSEGMAVHGLNISDTADVAKFYAYAGRVPARRGAAVSFIDHTPHRSKEQTGKEGRAIGSQHKIAGVDVAYGVTMRKPFGVGLTGMAAVSVVKDRPGQVRRHCAGDKHRDFAELTLSSSPSGETVRWVLAKPSEERFRPTGFMEKVSRALELADKPMSMRGVRENVSGRNEIKDLAVQVLVDEGYAEKVTGGLRSVQPYREVDDLMRAQSDGHAPSEGVDD